MSISAVPRRRSWLPAAAALTLVGALVAPWTAPATAPRASAAPGTAISGTVALPPAAETGDVAVTLVSFGNRGNLRTVAPLDDRGGYRFDKLAAGDFRLEFRSRSGDLVPHIDAGWRSATTRFTLASGEAAVHDVRMVRSASVAGVVKLPEGSPSRVGVALHFADDLGGWRSVRHAEVGTGGRYFFDGLAPGRYRVLVIPEGLSLVRTWSGGSTWAAEATVFGLAAGEEAEAAPVLVSRGVTLAGRTELPAGVSTDEVQVIVNSRATTLDQSAAWEFSNFTWVRPDGSFHLSGLPVGDQRVSFWHGRTKLADLPVRETSAGEIIDNLKLDA